MFRIGTFSKLSSVSIRMLRHYDKMGLLVPADVDDSTGFRSYCAAQLEQVNKIQVLKQFGFSLAIIKEMLEKEDTADLEQYFALRQLELKEELHQITTQSKLLEKANMILKERHDMTQYNVVLKEIPKRDVISVRNIIKTYMDEGMLWQQMQEEATKQQVKFAKESFDMAIFHDAEYKEADVEVEVQRCVVGGYKDTDNVRFYAAPSVQVVSVTFNGGYEQMPRIGEAVATWIEENNYQMDGPMFNIYHVSPGQDQNPANWVTEACYQVKAL